LERGCRLPNEGDEIRSFCLIFWVSEILFTTFTPPAAFRSLIFQQWSFLPHRPQAAIASTSTTTTS
jgi:hypothetical protein